MTGQKSPGQYDAVLGGQAKNVPSIGDVVLGGIEGIQRQLVGDDLVVKQRVLQNALGQGENGIKVLFEVLESEQPQTIKANAYALLQKVLGKDNPRVKEINKYRFFDNLRTLEGHSSSVNSVAISPNGNILISGSKDKTIKVWNLRKGNLLRTIKGHSDRVNSVAISPDGNILVSGGLMSFGLRVILIFSSFSMIRYLQLVEVLQLYKLCRYCMAAGLENLFLFGVKIGVL